MANRSRKPATTETAPKADGSTDTSQTQAAAASETAATAEESTRDLPAAGSTTRAEKSPKSKDGEAAHNEVNNPNAGATAAANEDRFQMQTNSAGLAKDHVVTRSQVVGSHAGVTVEDWLKRGIIKRTNDPVTPVQP
jgi:hypothetical protein